ncbi:MAG: flagellar basal body rod protein FlgB [Deltaproteobacteria bacterium]|nr:flagellar basal body rod protein FlgB [Deltaproteobacteria bacterium]
MKLFDNTLALLERSMDVRMERHNVLASNLANAETPNYTPHDVDFNAAMQDAVIELQQQQAMPDMPHVKPLRAPGVPEHPHAPLVPQNQVAMAPGLDGNKVDADRTLVSLAENGLQYGAETRAAGKKLSILRYVASDGNA